MKYVHTNIIAKDWKKLAEFYQKAFDCVPVPPERDLQGQWLDDLTGLENCRITGAHLSLPGYEEGGPTLEIFQYDEMPERTETATNTLGITHLAFLVDDVRALCDKCVALGASLVGKTVSSTYKDGRTLTVVYIRDPEGNIIELQNWKAPAQAGP